MALYRYWTGGVLWTTANDQMPIGSTVTIPVSASRGTDDTVLRAIAFAQVTYRSKGTNALIEGWWSAADVRLVLTHDKAGTRDPLDIDGEDPRILGWANLDPSYYATQTANHYVTTFKGPPAGLDVHGERKGGEAEILPAVLGTLFYYDQNGVFAGVTEPTGERRARLGLRVLWGTDVPPP